MPPKRAAVAKKKSPLKADVDIIEYKKKPSKGKKYPFLYEFELTLRENGKIVKRKPTQDEYNFVKEEVFDDAYINSPSYIVDMTITFAGAPSGNYFLVKGNYTTQKNKKEVEDYFLEAIKLDELGIRNGNKEVDFDFQLREDLVPPKPKSKTSTKSKTPTKSKKNSPKKKLPVKKVSPPKKLTKAQIIEKTSKLDVHFPGYYYADTEIYADGATVLVRFNRM